MIQFYAPDILQTLMLPEDESGHCCRVLRHQEGDIIAVVDGKGVRYSCRIVGAHHKRTAVEIVSQEAVPLPHVQRIAIAVAPTKNLDRMEWLTEKLTEIGVNDIIPTLCTHSERRELKTVRLEKIAVSAMKQSLKAIKPEIWPMTPISSVIAHAKEAFAQRFICYCADDVDTRRLLARTYVPQKDTCILIGPEGDFAPDEVRQALEAGFVPVTLGDNRLRTETAALVACDTCHILDQAKM